jgi:DNA-3-methyladenine glycosylase II
VSRRQTLVPGAALAHLREADPVMGSLVARVGQLEYGVEPDLWRALIGSIVGQQLSVAAAATIRARVAALEGGAFPSPRFLLSLPEEALRGCGLSRAKASYIRDIAERWCSGRFNAGVLEALPDEEFIQELVKLKGVGRWTAEMVLIFSLNRPDVLAVDDLGIRAAAQRAYSLEARPGKSELLRLAEPWRPYRSYASLYLWRSLAPA